MTNCIICGDTFAFRWTDMHGVGRCWRCGMPYRLIHYDEDRKRVEKPPETTIKPEWVPLFKRYWEETGNMVDPGAYCFMTVPQEQVDAFQPWEDWMDAHKDEWPKSGEGDEDDRTRTTAEHRGDGGANP